MGTINDAIEAINGRSDISKEEMKAQRAAAKILGWNAFIDGRLPFTLQIDAKRAVTFVDVQITLTPNGSPMITSYGEYRKDNVTQPWSWPWKIINPPVLVPSNKGNSDAARTENETTRYFKEDLLEALRQIADISFR